MKWQELVAYLTLLSAIGFTGYYALKAFLIILNQIATAPI